MDIATLGMSIEFKDAKNAAAALDKLSDSAAKTQAAADGLTESTGRARDAQGRFVGVAASVATGLGTQAQAMNGATTAVRANTTAANQNAVAVKNMALNSANLAAQLNDIGVTAAMGMSPLQIALQQGSQISQVFGNMGAGAAVKSLGAAFMSVISPVSLLTIGIVAAVAALGQYIFGVEESGTKSEESLGKQIGLIRGVTTEWEGAVPALQAYLDQLEAASAAEGLKSQTAAAVSAQYAALREQVADLSSPFAALINDLDLVGEKRTVIAGLNTAFQEFKSGVDAGTAGTAEFQAVQAALTAAVNSSGISAIDSFASSFGALAGAVAAASEKMRQLQTDAAEAVKSKAEVYGPTFPIPNSPATPTPRPLIELEGLPGQYNSDGSLRGAKKARSGGKSPAEEFADLTAGAERTIATLTATEQALGMTAEAAAKLKYETQLLNQAQAAGIALTPQQSAELSVLADRMATVEVATTKAKDAARDAAKQAQEDLRFMKGATSGFFDDFRDGIESGKGFWRSWGDAALGVLDRVVDKIQDDLVDALFSANKAGGGGGFLGSIFGGLGSLFGGGGDLFGGVSVGTTDAILGGAVGMFAKGTNYAPGGPAIVGERGPELVNLPRGSQVIPNHALSRMQAPANTSAAPSITMGDTHLMIQGNADDRSIEQMRDMLRQRDKDLPRQVIAAYNDAKRRSVIR